MVTPEEAERVARRLCEIACLDPHETVQYTRGNSLLYGPRWVALQDDAKHYLTWFRACRAADLNSAD